MDEILSSIRQIIADDDAAGQNRRPGAAGVPDNNSPAPVAQARPVPANAVPRFDDDADEDVEAPLPLSREQIVPRENAPAAAAPAQPAAQPMSFEALVESRAAQLQREEPKLVHSEDVAFVPEPAPSRPEPVAARPEPVRAESPLPDPKLSSDLAEQLLDTTTGSAVRHTFARLQSVGVGTQGLTIEAMIRDMLRPMLKDWLDENLPSVVERMVEREIARVSRGGSP